MPHSSHCHCKIKVGKHLFPILFCRKEFVNRLTKKSHSGIHIIMMVKKRITGVCLGLHYNKALGNTPIWVLVYRGVLRAAVIVYLFIYNLGVVHLKTVK